MPYIDSVYFTENSDITIDETELDILINRASEIINVMTINLQGWAFEDLPTLTQDKLKLSTVAEVEALYLAGGTESLAGSNLSSAAIGKFSYSEGGGESSIPISPMISLYLTHTGLLYRGLC